MRTTRPTVAEFNGNAPKYYAAVVEYNKYLSDQLTKQVLAAREQALLFVESNEAYEKEIKGLKELNKELEDEKSKMSSWSVQLERIERIKELEAFKKRIETTVHPRHWQQGR